MDIKYINYKFCFIKHSHQCCGVNDNNLYLSVAHVFYYCFTRKENANIFFNLKCFIGSGRIANAQYFVGFHFYIL